jgi:hypothetical protein
MIAQILGLAGQARKRLFSGLSPALFAVLCLFLGSVSAFATDLPVAAGSPIAGISFDDRPLLLPVQRNFQMAMLTASSELGRTCGHIESYGWRMKTNEQGRVNQIFNNTVDRLRAQGFAVESKAPTSVSKDVTLFTADRPDKHLIFLWSAGEIGLVMVLCETSAPLTDTLVRTGHPEPQPVPGGASQGTLQLPASQSYPEMAYPVKARSEPLQLTRTGRPAYTSFSPLGDWVGVYSCAQGTTGGTLQIEHVQGERFDGIFRFYPTPKNPTVPTGKYRVYGEYDRDSQRILINPGKWLQRPKDYYNTIMIGSFDPVGKTFSGFFQGITGCTSFEAKYSPDSAEIIGEQREPAKAHLKKPVKKKAKKKVQKKPVEAPKAEAPKDTLPAVEKPSETPKAEAPPAKEPQAIPEAPGIDLGNPMPEPAQKTPTP